MDRMYRRSALTRRTALVGAGALAAGLATGRSAQADTVTRLVVPFPAGGGTDVVGRLLAQGLQEALGRTVIVENVPGATGTLGSARVARAPADGHTLLLGISATHAIAPALMPGLPYRPERDFVGLGRIAFGGNLLAAHPAYPARTAPELVAHVRASREPLMYGSWGNGSGGHLAGESIRASTGIDMRHVPYKGVAPLLQDLSGGQVEVAVVDMAAGLPLLQAGRIKALAVTGSKRSSALPQTPTLREGGIPFGTDSWYALFAPAGLAPGQQRLLEDALERVLRQPALVERIRAMGMEPEPTTAAAFRMQWHEDMATWARLVASSGARAE